MYCGSGQVLARELVSYSEWWLGGSKYSVGELKGWRTVSGMAQ